MEAKEFDFEFPRGDTTPVSFELKITYYRKRNQLEV